MVYRRHVRWPLACGLALVAGVGLWLSSSDKPFPITEDSRDLRPRHDPVMEHQLALLARLGFAGRQDSVLIVGDGGGPRRGLDELVTLRDKAQAMTPSLLYRAGTFLDIWARTRDMPGLINAREEVDWEGLAELAAAYPNTKSFGRILNGYASRSHLLPSRKPLGPPGRVVHSAMASAGRPGSTCAG